MKNGRLRFSLHLVAIAFILGIPWLLGTLIGPPLLADIAHRNDPPIAATDLRVQEATCRNFFFFVAADCTVAYAPVGALGPKRTLQSFHLGRQGGEPVVLVRSASDPTYVSTTLARDSLLNRTITFFVWCMFELAFLAFYVTYWLKLLTGRLPRRTV